MLTLGKIAADVGGRMLRKRLSLGAVAMACTGLIAAAPATAKPRRVEYTRSVFRMEEGAVWAHLSGGASCNVDLGQLHWTREGSEIHTERLGTTFRQALADLGGAPEDDNLFEEASPRADLQIAAAISDMRGSFCAKEETSGYSGSLSMTVQWQVYDPAARQLVGKFETHATGQTSYASAAAVDALFLAAFRENARDLMSDSAFQRLLRQSADLANATPASIPTSTQTRLVFTPARSTESMTLPQAVQSVVLVQTNDGHGSGFLISPDGYILTNHHVVGSARTVRVRWPDGTDQPAQVLRVDRARDIALIKADTPPGRPLALKPASPAQGETVFAIGAPLDPSLQGTLTRGIVSANRVIDGQPFIQSDVAITHGNSGGPLLNERGEVVGVAQSMIAENGASVSLNLFIPIGDALRALSLTPASGEPPTVGRTQTRSSKRRIQREGVSE